MHLPVGNKHPTGVDKHHPRANKHPTSVRNGHWKTFREAVEILEKRSIGPKTHKPNSPWLFDLPIFAFVGRRSLNSPAERTGKKIRTRKQRRAERTSGAYSLDPNSKPPLGQLGNE